MDTMRRIHEKEMSAQRTANARANTKLERLTEVTSVIERERDECRDAALELIQKGRFLYSRKCRLALFAYDAMTCPAFS